MVMCGLSNRREHQEKALGMKHYAGLDVSLKEISIRIVDQTGSVCREMKAPSHSGDLACVILNPSRRPVRTGREARPLSRTSTPNAAPGLSHPPCGRSAAIVTPTASRIGGSSTLRRRAIAGRNAFCPFRVNRECSRPALGDASRLVRLAL